MKPLLVVFKAREIPQFLEALGKIQCDKLIMEYYPQEEAYFESRKWFLEHKEYTHFIIIPDDLVVTPEVFDLIAYAPDFPSISGWCNNTALKTENKVPFDAPDVDTNISRYSPPGEPKRGRYAEYRWMTIAEAEKLQKQGIIGLSVLHQGFALTRLSRELVEQIPFRSAEGCCIDTCLSIDLLKARIPQYVDMRARCFHIAYQYSQINVGIKPKIMITP